MNNNLYHEKYDGSNEAEVFRHEVIMDVDYQDYWHNRGWRRLNVWTTRDNVGNPDFIGDKPIFRKKKIEVVTLILRKFIITTSHVEVQKQIWRNVEFKPFIKKWNEIMIE